MLEPAMVVFKDGEERIFTTEMYAPPSVGTIVFVRADENLVDYCAPNMAAEWAAQLRQVREQRFKVAKVYLNPILRTKGAEAGGGVADGWKLLYIVQCVEVFDE